MYPVLNARFVLVDDHEILRFAEHPETTLASVIGREAQTIGRFRPVYWAVRLGEVRVMGENPTAWHAFVLTFAIAAALMLFWVARGTGIDTLPATLAAASLLVGPGVSSLWVRLGPPETFATVLFLISLSAAVAASRGRVGWDVLFVLSGVLAGLTKEPFALASVGLAIFRLLVQGQSWRRTRGLIASGLVVAAGLAVAIVDYRISGAAGTATYGGRYLAGANLISYLESFAHNALIVVYASCVWIALIAAGPILTRRFRFGSVRFADRRLSVLGLLAACVAIPQLGLYSVQGVMEGRYEVPSTVALSLLLAGTLGYAGARCRGSLYRLAVAGWAGVLVLFGLSTWSYASAFTADSRELDAMLTTVARSSPTGGVVGLVVDPGRRYEPALSILDQLAWRGRSDLSARLIAVNLDGAYNTDESALAQNLQTQIPSLDASDCARLVAVIVLADGSDESEIGCPLATLRPRDFSDRVLVWGGESVSFRPRLPGLVALGYRAYLS